MDASSAATRSGVANSAMISRPGRRGGSSPASAASSRRSRHGSSGFPMPRQKITWRLSPGASSRRTWSEEQELSPTVSVPPHSPRSTASGLACVRYGPRKASRSVSNPTTSAPAAANHTSLAASRVELVRWIIPSRYVARTTYWLYWRFSRSCRYFHSLASSA